MSLQQVSQVLVDVVPLLRLCDRPSLYLATLVHGKSYLQHFPGFIYTLPTTSTPEHCWRAYAKWLAWPYVHEQPRFLLNLAGKLQPRDSEVDAFCDGVVHAARALHGRVLTKKGMLMAVTNPKCFASFSYCRCLPPQLHIHGWLQS